MSARGRLALGILKWTEWTDHVFSLDFEYIFCDVRMTIQLKTYALPVKLYDPGFE